MQGHHQVDYQEIRRGIPALAPVANLQVYQGESHGVGYHRLWQEVESGATEHLPKRST